MKENIPIGELIGRLAQQKGISIRNLAGRVGMNYQTLYAAIKRKNNSINSKYIPLLAKELGVSPEYLTGIENPYDDLTYPERELLRSLSHITSSVDEYDRGDLLLHVAFFLEQQKDLIVQTFVSARDYNNKEVNEPEKLVITDEDLYTMFGEYSDEENDRNNI